MTIYRSNDDHNSYDNDNDNDNDNMITISSCVNECTNNTIIIVF